MHGGLPLDTARAAALGYRGQEKLPAWAGKLVWKVNDDDRATYEANPLPWRDIRLVIRRARRNAAGGGVAGFPPGYKKLEESKQQPQDLVGVLAILDRVAVKICKHLTRDNETLVRAYGDAHIALDQTHKLSLA